MFTAIKLGDSINVVDRRRVVTVQFTNTYTNQEFVKDFSFGLNETDLVMRKTVKVYLDELNAPKAVITDGVLDFTDIKEPAPPTPTQAELEFEEWQKDRKDLKKLKELIAEGIIPANSPQLTTLQNKVNTGFKPAYFSLI